MVPVGAAVPGSSPLARGLRSATSCYTHCARIIPARAGFTRDEGPEVGLVGDHPRSRGVYNSPVYRWPTYQGSSPLARGLPSLECCYGLLLRIIPARAGFTRHMTRHTQIAPDHPRSRGVYRRMAGFDTDSVGSSPLARGLLDSPHLIPPRPRIIPARAGFTSVGSCSTSSTRDHPRSRGVYHMVHSTKLLLVGSSPLARGLLQP